MKNRWLFEAPFAAEVPADYSEGTGRKKAANRIDPRLVDSGDIQRGGVERIRKPRQKPPRRVIPSETSISQVKQSTDPREIARQKANQQGATLVSLFKKQLEKSNPSGTAVRAQARLRAGAEMIRQAKKKGDRLLADAYRTVGQQLIDKGKADIHPSKS